MRVAFVFPNYWPYVRRGAERLMAEYAQALIARGHAVDIITSKPGRPKVVRDGALTVYFDRRLDHPLLKSVHTMFRFYSFSATSARRLVAQPYDVAHTWLYTYGSALRLARSVRGTPYLYHIMANDVGLPGPADAWMRRRFVSPADRVAALTPECAERTSRQLGVPVKVLPGCVDMEQFTPGPRDLERPKVLFTSDVADYRKGVTLLLKAWNEVHAALPNAVLSLAGPYGQVGFPAVRTLDLVRGLVRSAEARAAIEFPGEGRLEDLPRRYAEAAVTALPSVDEAFGLVLVESLAAGTPVVGSSFDGPGGIITDPGIGATMHLRGYEDLEAPERAHELAQAILRAIELVHDPATAARCRNHARRWSREAIGEALEQTYLAMTGAPAAGRVASPRLEAVPA